MGVDALAIPRDAIPEIVDGRALEDGEEEEEQPDDNGDSHGDVEDHDVDAIDGDPEEGEDNGDLGQDAGENVEDLAEEPALFLRLVLVFLSGVQRRAVPVMLTAYIEAARQSSRAVYPCHTWRPGDHRSQMPCLITRQPVSSGHRTLLAGDRFGFTMAITIKPSSHPKARTIRTRTKHRSKTVTNDTPKKTAVTMVMTSL